MLKPQRYNQSPASVALCDFTRTMSSWSDIIWDDTTILLSKDSDLFKFPKGMVSATQVIGQNLFDWRFKNCMAKDKAWQRRSDEQVRMLDQSRLREEKWLINRTSMLNSKPETKAGFQVKRTEQINIRS